MAQARRYSRATSKRALVHEALATYVAVKAGEQRRASYRERLLEVRRQASKVKLRSDSRDILRAARNAR